MPWISTQIGSHTLGKTELEIISRLFLYRSGTAEQVTYMIQPELANVDRKQKTSPYTGRVKYIARKLSELVKKGLCSVFKTTHSMKLVYYLSPEGLNCAYTIHGIEEHVASLASGWGSDFGYFDYVTYRPPQDRYAHHEISVTFHIDMMHYAGKGKYTYSFIDNRYASREFHVLKQGKRVKRYFRPDGEFKLNDSNHFWLEIDMSTERGERLTEKFESYRDYIDDISEGISFSQINETPSAILFHTTANYISSRWVSVFNAFMQKMGPYTPLVNFRLTNSETLEVSARAEVNSDLIVASVKSNLKFYLSKESGFVGLPKPGPASSSFVKLMPSDEDILGWSPNIVISTKNDGSSYILLFERMEGYETLGIARVIDFVRRLDQLDIGKSGQITEVVPVLYYYEVAPDDNPYKGGGGEIEMRRIFSKLIIHDAKRNLWFDGNDRAPIQTNPLLHRSH
ncbi:replication-relaxation family protein [Paenibacillus sp. Y412MC10]|uniref:replication-relaxation family protein n=1 Tax=Geobacillus sp. (strain Y412MC10) TaxID=481743 RepID=UPI0011AB8CA3|nr:replication-relaxation family protein [Paenibacillus sp. Y412MC10]